MSEGAMHHPAADAFEPPLFGAYSKKVGMWLFLVSDSLTFGALLFAYSYGRIATHNWPTPFGAHSIANATIMTACLLSSSLTMVLAVLATRRGDSKWRLNWLLATMAFGTAFIVLHAMEWNGLIRDGMRLAVFPPPPGAEEGAAVGKMVENVPQFAATFFGLTGMHMLHVTIGVVYLGIIALGRKFIPILLVLWLVAWQATPSYSVFKNGSHVLLVCAIIAGVIVFFKPKKYDEQDVEVSGLYWHFVDLVWMFIFPLVYLMSTKI
ncbi:MAG: cytochrome c oxidase subunit 3 [Terriglobales bacterium]